MSSPGSRSVRVSLFHRLLPAILMWSAAPLFSQPMNEPMSIGQTWYVVVSNRDHGTSCPTALLELSLSDDENNVFAFLRPGLPRSELGVDTHSWQILLHGPGDYFVDLALRTCQDDRVRNVRIPVYVASPAERRNIQIVLEGEGEHWRPVYFGVATDRMGDGLLEFDRREVLRVRNLTNSALLPCRVGFFGMQVELIEINGTNQAESSFSYPDDLAELPPGEWVTLEESLVSVHTRSEQGAMAGMLLKIRLRPHASRHFYFGEEPRSGTSFADLFCDTYYLYAPRPTE